MKRTKWLHIIASLTWDEHQTTLSQLVTYTMRASLHPLTELSQPEREMKNYKKLQTTTKHCKYMYYISSWHMILHMNITKLHEHWLYFATTLIPHYMLWYNLDIHVHCMINTCSQSCIMSMDHLPYLYTAELPPLSHCQIPSHSCWEPAHTYMYSTSFSVSWILNPRKQHAHIYYV